MTTTLKARKINVRAAFLLNEKQEKSLTETEFFQDPNHFLNDLDKPLLATRVSNRQLLGGAITDLLRPGDYLIVELDSLIITVQVQAGAFDAYVLDSGEVRLLTKLKKIKLRAKDSVKMNINVDDNKVISSQFVEGPERRVILEKEIDWIRKKLKEAGRQTVPSENTRAQRVAASLETAATSLKETNDLNNLLKDVATLIREFDQNEKNLRVEISSLKEKIQEGEEERLSLGKEQVSLTMRLMTTQRELANLREVLDVNLDQELSSEEKADHPER